MSNNKINFEQFPNFLIIGANKAGTTSIYSYCSQHPQIFMSKIKEPMFFSASPEFANTLRKNNNSKSSNLANPKVVNSIEEYQNLFVGGESAIARGEASTSYLASPSKTIPKIKSMNPSMKIIACLRNPIDRAFSGYTMYHSAGLEKRSFEEAIADEIAGKFDGVPPGRRYLCLGKYYWSLKKYLQAFGEEKVLILLFDDLKQNPTQFVKNIFDFLDVDSNFSPSTNVKLNTSGHWLKNKEKPKISDKARTICQRFFSEDMKRLDEFISIEHTNWLME